MGKDADHADGLAERSVNTSIVHPGQGASNHQKGNGDRTLTDNQQREGLEKSVHADPKPDADRKL